MFKINTGHVAVTALYLNPCRPLARKSEVEHMQYIMACRGVEKHINSGLT
jgi:hypothetical protein